MFVMIQETTIHSLSMANQISNRVKVSQVRHSLETYSISSDMR